MKIGHLLVVVFAACAVACAGKPFDVKRIQPVAPESLGGPAFVDPLAVRATAIWDEDWLLETLGANAILARVLPVRIDVENRGAAPVELEDLELELTGAGGGRFKTLDASEARKRIEGYYGSAFSTKSGEQAYREDFAINALETKEPLAPGARRQGLVFFEIPKGVEAPVRATLGIALRSEAASLPLAVESGTR